MAALASPAVASEVLLAPRLEPPSLAGHDAEARARDPEAEALWRRLFFDTADREVGESGVSCDHRRARRPEAIRGIGFVAVATDGAGRLRARLWGEPEGGGIDLLADRAVLEARLRALLPPEDATIAIAVEARVFAWCR